MTMAPRQTSAASSSFGGWVPSGGPSVSAGQGPLGGRLLRPHALVQRYGLVFEQRPRNLCRPLATGKNLATGQVERRVLRMIAGDAAQAVLAEAIDDTADAGPVDRAGAHRAGLGGGIERGLRQHLAAERAAGLRRSEALGMRRAVVIRHVAVLGLDQHLA